MSQLLLPSQLSSVISNIPIQHMIMIDCNADKFEVCALTLSVTASPPVSPKQMAGEADSTAKLMLHLLKTVPTHDPSTPSQDAIMTDNSGSSSSHCEDALSRFEQLEELLESYAHPSNTGTVHSWWISTSTPNNKFYSTTAAS